MTAILEPLLQYGAIGAILVALIVYLNTLVKSHRKEQETIAEQHKREREEWRAQSERQFTQVVKIVETNTSALSDLKSTILAIIKK